MTSRKESWLRSNWAALVAGGYFLAALLDSLKWFRFHNEDKALDAVFSLFFAIMFMIGHRKDKSYRKYLEEMNKVKAEHPLPWETKTTSAK